MYFNRRVLFASVVLASLNGAQATAACSQSFVKAASDAGFLEYALLNCVSATQAGSLNSLGKAILDSQSCLTSFQTAKGVAFSNQPAACQNQYTTFVKEVAADAVLAGNKSPFEDIAGSHEGCYDAPSKKIMVSYVCWNRLSKRLTEFQQGAGYPIFIAPCDAATIRDLTLSKVIQKTFTDVLSATTTADQLKYGVFDFRSAGAGSNGVDHIVVPGWKQIGGKYMNDNIDLKTGMCYGGYQTLLDLIQGSDSVDVITTPALGVATFGASRNVGGTTGGPASWGLADLQTACKADITAPACANSQLLTGLKSLFTSFTGYDMQFAGPLCTADKITSLNTALNPTPFQFFAKCGLLSSDFASECSQASLDQYMILVNSTVGSECRGCFVGLSNDIKASNATVKAACNSTAAFSSATCVAALGDVIARYKNCTGSDLNTGNTTLAPVTPTVNTTSTTATPTGDANDATRIMMSSGAILLVAVMTYLM